MSDNEFENTVEDNTAVGRLMFQTNISLLKATLQQTAVLKILTITFDAVKNVFGKLALNLTKFSDSMERSIKEMHRVIEDAHARFGAEAKEVGGGDAPNENIFSVAAGLFRKGIEEGVATLKGKAFILLGDVLTKSATPLKLLRKVLMPIGGSKFVKGAKAMGGMVKELMGSSLQAWALQQLMKLIEPLMMLLDPLAVLFDIIGALLMVMVGEALGPFYDAMQPIYDTLLTLIPLFSFIGVLIGILIQVALIPLTIVFELLFAVLEPFMPLIEPWLPVLRQVSVIIRSFTSNIKNLGKAMGAARKAAKDFWKMLDSAGGGGGSGGGKEREKFLGIFQRGGTLQDTGTFFGHKGEEVVSGPSAYLDSANIERMMEAMEFLAMKKGEKSRWD